MVLSVGALTPQKAHDLIIESLALIPRDLRPVLGIAFSSAIDKEREYLSELGQRLGVRIRWFDSVRGYDGMSELYSRAALVVATGVMEGLGRAPLEAMACETPAIAVREGGLRETIRDGVDGLLVDRDPDALARAIESLLTDSALRERLVREGRKSVEQYWTLDRAASVLEQHLEATARRAARSTGVRQC
jgi:glycosyltransferase involved in cell wall biosynthesis